VTVNNRRSKTVRKTISALVLTAAATAGLAAVTGSAQAQAGFTNGPYIPSTSVSFAGCSGEVQAGTSNSDGSVVARGWFTLNTSTRGLACQGWLQRRTNSSSPWGDISYTHVGSSGQTVGTDYYYDGAGYQVRVCVGDFLYSNSYSCGAGW
jgi:hypothetical protein